MLTLHRKLLLYGGLCVMNDRPSALRRCMDSTGFTLPPLPYLHHCGSSQRCNHNSYTHPLIQQKVGLSSHTCSIYTAVSNATELLVFKPRRAQCLRQLSLQGHNHLTKITWKRVLFFSWSHVHYPGAQVGLRKLLYSAISSFFMQIPPYLFWWQKTCYGNKTGQGRKGNLGK